MMHYVNVITNSGNLKQPGRDTILIDYYYYYCYYYYVSKITDAIVSLSCDFLSSENRSARYLQNLKCKSTWRILCTNASRCKGAFTTLFSCLKLFKKIIMQETLYFAVLYTYCVSLSIPYSNIFYYRFRKYTVFPFKLKIVCKVRVPVARWHWISIHRFDETSRVYRSSRTMTKGEVNLCTERGHYDRQPVYDRGNNSTLAVNLCIRQHDNEKGMQKQRVLFCNRHCKIPIF